MYTGARTHTRRHKVLEHTYDVPLLLLATSNSILFFFWPAEQTSKNIDQSEECGHLFSLMYVPHGKSMCVQQYIRTPSTTYIDYILRKLISGMRRAA